MSHSFPLFCVICTSVVSCIYILLTWCNILSTGPIFNLDEVLFKEAYKLLSIILETNAQTGKHMLFYETGKHILDLIEVIFCYSIYMSIINTFKYHFHATMARFQLELIYYFTYFSTAIPSNRCVFLSYRPFIVNTTFSTGLVSVEVKFCNSIYISNINTLKYHFHAPKGRFQLELIYYFTYVSTVVHPTIVCFFPVGLSSLIQHFQLVLWVLKMLL